MKFKSESKIMYIKAQNQPSPIIVTILIIEESEVTVMTIMKLK